MRRRKHVEPPVTSNRPGFRVERVVRHGARRLVVVGPTARLWTLADDPNGYDVAGLRGALVKAQPPPDVSPERVEAVRAWLVSVGVAAVRLVPAGERHEAAPAEVVAAERRTVRAVVSACAEKAHTQDRAALDAVLDEALTAEGL